MGAERLTHETSLATDALRWWRGFVVLGGERTTHHSPWRIRATHARRHAYTTQGAHEARRTTRHADTRTQGDAYAHAYTTRLRNDHATTRRGRTRLHARRRGRHDTTDSKRPTRYGEGATRHEARCSTECYEVARWHDTRRGGTRRHDTRWCVVIRHTTRCYSVALRGDLRGTTAHGEGTHGEARCYEVGCDEATRGEVWRYDTRRGDTTSDEVGCGDTRCGVVTRCYEGATRRGCDTRHDEATHTTRRTPLPWRVRGRRPATTRRGVRRHEAHAEGVG